MICKRANTQDMKEMALGTMPKRLIRHMQNADVSVIILTHNSARTIEACLRSIVKEHPGEILAVHSSSTDQTLAILESYAVRIVSTREESIGHKRQLGVKAARGIYVMFVDSDMELKEGCIRTLRSELEKNGWAGIQARLLSRDNSTYWQRAEDEKFRLFSYRTGPADLIGAGGALFRRDLLLSHPFDPCMRLASEDVDLCRRLVQEKYHLGLSSAFVYHCHRREFPAFVRQVFRYGQGNVQLYRKYRFIRDLTAPFQTYLFLALYCSVTKRIRLVPYWVVICISRFLGLVVGFSQANRTRIPTWGSVIKRGRNRF